MNILNIHTQQKTSHRYRGAGRPATPATPPGMRVRTGRFGGLSWIRTHHGRKPELSKVGIGQGSSERASSRVARDREDSRRFSPRGLLTSSHIYQSITCRIFPSMRNTFQGKNVTNHVYGRLCDTPKTLSHLIPRSHRRPMLTASAESMPDRRCRNEVLLEALRPHQPRDRDP